MHDLAAASLSTGIFASPEFLWFLIGVIVGFILTRKIG